MYSFYLIGILKKKNCFSIMVVSKNIPAACFILYLLWLNGNKYELLKKKRENMGIGYIRVGILKMRHRVWIYDESIILL